MTAVTTAAAAVAGICRVRQQWSRMTSSRNVFAVRARCDADDATGEPAGWLEGLPLSPRTLARAEPAEVKSLKP
jgi:hypothetical protein